MRTPDDWPAVASQITLAAVSGQVQAADLAAGWATAELGSDAAGVVQPTAFGGQASDGRAMESLLYGAVVHARTGRAEKDAQNLVAAERWLDMYIRTQVADTARAALQTSFVVRPGTGGTRMVVPPCCGRCAILSGRFYRWDAGFERHPRCDCTFAPTRGTPVEVDEVPLDQIRGLSKADRHSIEMGANRAQVINAHRGMYVADGGVKATTTNAGRGVRLRPESILQHSTSRADAERLLRLHGYIL